MACSTCKGQDVVRIATEAAGAPDCSLGLTQLTCALCKGKKVCITCNSTGW